MRKHLLAAMMAAASLLPAAAMAQERDGPPRPGAREGRPHGQPGGGQPRQERREAPAAVAPRAPDQSGGFQQRQARGPDGGWQRPHQMGQPGGWQQRSSRGPDGGWQQRVEPAQQSGDTGGWQQRQPRAPDAGWRRPPQQAPQQVQQAQSPGQPGGWQQRRDWRQDVGRGDGAQRDRWQDRGDVNRDDLNDGRRWNDGRRGGDDARRWDGDRGNWNNGRGGYGNRNTWSDQRRWDGDRGGWNRGGGWNRDWRRDGRYDWNRYRLQNRNLYHLPRYYAPYGWNYGYRQFAIGAYLSQVLFEQSYWIDDPWSYRLPEADGPYRWVRYYNDALLVDIYSGEVVDVIHGIFW